MCGGSTHRVPTSPCAWSTSRTSASICLPSRSRLRCLRHFRSSLARRVSTSTLAPPSLPGTRPTPVAERSGSYTGLVRAETEAEAEAEARGRRPQRRRVGRGGEDEGVRSQAEVSVARHPRPSGGTRDPSRSAPSDRTCDLNIFGHV
eukprot:1182949-Prorocentrum_minimum.AAC.2